TCQESRSRYPVISCRSACRNSGTTFLGKRNDMMHDPAVAGTNLDGSNVLVLGEVGRYREIDILVAAFSADLELLRHREYDIRLTNPPALYQHLRCCTVSRSTF